MRRYTALTVLQQNNEINMTPLIDLTFLLLITFIITFPLLEQGIPIRLPKGNASSIDAAESRTIALDKDGIVYLDNREISTADLATDMNRLGQANPDLVVLVRADEEIAYGKVAGIMKILHDAKITKLALVTQAEGPPAP